MATKKTGRNDPADLRRRAEEKAGKKADPTPETLEAVSPEEARRILHELQVHQIELEMQNEELRRAQVELDRARARYFDLYDLAPVGYLTLNEKGMILEANLKAASLFGVTRATLVEQPITRFIIKEDQDVYYQHRKRLFETGEPQTCEIRMLKRNKATFWVQMEAGAARDADDKPVCRVVISDISERKQSQEELERFLDLIPEMVCIASTDGFFKKLNASWEDVLGYTQEEMLRTPFTEFIHPDDRDATLAAVERRVAGGKTVGFINRYRCKDGSYRWFEWLATPAVDGTLLYAAARDVTERMRTEEALREGREMINNIVATSQDWIWAIDTQGIHTYSNPAFEKILGYKPEETLGKTNFDLLHEDDRAKVESMMPQWIEKKCGWNGLLFRWRHKDGSYRYLESNSVAILDAQGTLVGFRGVDRDVTRRKRAEEALQESEARLRLALVATNQGLFDLDLRSGTTVVTPEYMTMLGYTAGEIEPTVEWWVSSLHPDDRDSVVATLRACTTGETADHQIEFRIRTREGGWKWIQSTGKVVEHNADGMPTRMIGIHSDIDGRRKAEEALTKEKEFTEIALNSQLDTFFVFEPVSGRAIRWNRAFRDITGYTDEEIASLKAPDVYYSPEDLGKAASALKSVIRDGKATVELFLICKDGQRILTEYEASLIPAQRGEPEYVIAIGRNITERKLAEAALRESDERLRLTARAGNVGLWDWDLRTNLVSFSQEWKRQIGYEEGEISDSFDEWESRVHPEDLEPTRKKVEEYIKNPVGLHEVEFRFRHKDGSYRWILTHARVLRDENGKPVRMLGSHVDITNLKAAEEALRESQERFSKVLSNAENVAVQGYRPDGTVTFWNRASERFYGYTASEMIGKDLIAILHGTETAEAQRRLMEEAVRTGNLPPSEELEVICKDGRKLWVLASRVLVLQPGKEQEFFCFDIDITDSKKAEMDLARERRRLADIIRGTNVGTWEWNVQTGETRYNDRWAEIVGYTVAELSPISIHTWLDMTHPDDLKESGERLDKHFRGESDCYESEVRMRHKDGTWVWVLDRGRVHTWTEDGKPLLMSGTHQDITKRKRAEEALRESEATVRRKLKAITEPEGDIGTLSLSDLIDRESLQGMMENLYEITHICSAVYDVSGNELVIVGLNDVCTRFHRVHPDTLKNCMEHDLILAEGVPAGAFRAYRCSNNLWNMVTPIFVGDRHLGNIFIGPFFYDDEIPDYIFFRKQAGEYGFDERDYISALDRVPRRSRETINAAMSFYAKLAGMISSLGYTTVGLSRALAQQDKALVKRRESEERHRSLVENTPDVVMRFDRRLRHLFVNKAVENVLALTAEDFIGKTHRELGFPEKQCSFWEAALENVFQTGLPSEEEFSIDSIRGPVTFNRRLIPERGPSGEIETVLSIARDITAQRKIEHDYAQLFNTMSSGFAVREIIVDEAGEPCDYRFLSVNPAYERLTGRKAENIVGRRVLDVLPNTGKEWIQRYGRVALSGEGISFENYDEDTQKYFEVVVYSPVRGQFASIFHDITKRKRTEEALRESEERYRALFESSRDALMTLSPSSWMFTSCNQAALEMFGAKDVHEFTSLGPWNMSPERQPDGRPSSDKTREMIETAMREGSNYFEWTHRRLSGVDFHATVLLTRLEIKGETALQATVRDITDQKRAEEESSRLASVIRHSRELVNLATPDGMMFFLNDTGKEMLGISEEDVPRTNIMQVIPEHLKDKVQGEVLLSIKEKGFWEGDVQYLNLKTGGLTDVYATTFKIADPHTGALQFLANVSLDITERKHVERALRESEEKYRSLFNRSQDGIYRSTHDGHFLDVNPAMVKMFGYNSREEMLALDIPRDIYFSPEDRVGELATGGGEEVSVLRQRRKDGSEIWVEDHGHYVHDDEGNVVFHEGILRDVTDRKRAEEEKQKLQEQLSQAQKMESVGRLAGGVAHDFNNMLGVILGRAEMAMEHVEPGQPLYVDLEEIFKAAEHSANLTRQLLAFARKQAITPRVLDLNDTLEGMLKMLRRLIGEDIDLAWRPGPDVGRVKIDPSQVDQILANLCVNARDAIAETGRITIETGNVTLDADYVADHPGSTSGEFVVLSVSDTGSGMDKSVMEHLFEPFFTTKAFGQGTGLGLATVYGIVKQNNGFISVYSEPGHGTTFRIYLPRYLDKSARALEADRTGPAPHGRETVLLVEDEPAILKMSTRILEKLGYTVLPAGTPGEAVRLAEEHAGEINLLMTDVIMPEMNGRDLAKRLLTLYPNLKRLFTSGYTADIIAHRGVLEEGVHFLQKPFSMKELAAKIREALDSD